VAHGCRAGLYQEACDTVYPAASSERRALWLATWGLWL
jgi:hypothetical protein